MAHVPDSTESLLIRTKKLLQEPRELTLREIAQETDVSYEWLRSVRYRDPEKLNPTAAPLERVHNFLVEYHAARRFQLRAEEARAT